MSPQKKNDNLQAAKTVVYRLLNIRLRSEWELNDYLQKKYFAPKVIQDCLQYFKNIELIDDHKFARLWINSRLKKPYGLNRIRLELFKKGIDPQIVEHETNLATLDQIPEIEIIRDLALKQLKRYGQIEQQKINQRLYGFLFRRGYQAQNILKVINDIQNNKRN
ncbi:MAG: RecX family transcriptional regulator [Candidatus Omnitrophica bacterium]|nr:RecX family transcriptional regulator [Candidatus Omnitrophota bacterium]